MSQLALGWHFPYIVKPIDNKSSKNPKTINKKSQMQQKHEHNNSKSQANNFTTILYLALSSHYVLTMLTTLQYELIGWLWTKK
jgi:formate-dependent phosphoribosylglycinamide formyltransferase (GAR transformylase)